MFKKYRILKWIGLSLVTLLIIVVSFGFWFMSLIPQKDEKLATTVVKDLPYLSEDIIPFRGKILAVVTSTNKMGASKKKTGYELTELSRAYYVFEANGFEVDISSPLGGNATAIIDDDDMAVFDFAFLNDSIAQNKAKHTIPIKEVVADDYQAIYFVGGKGAMYDFPNNKTIQSIVKNYHESNKVIGAVCHGPAALVNVILANGRPFLENRTISGFTNEEELLLIPDAKSIFPFLLQEKMIARGANFNKGEMYLENVSYDEKLITGQNPWSIWTLAENMIKELGYTPKHRVVTAEENAVKVLLSYRIHGKQEAKRMIEKLLLNEGKLIDRNFIAVHSIIAAMKGEVVEFFEILNLASYTKKCLNVIQNK